MGSSLWTYGNTFAPRIDSSALARNLGTRSQRITLDDVMLTAKVDAAEWKTPTERTTSRVVSLDPLWMQRPHGDECLSMLYGHS